MEANQLINHRLIFQEVKDDNKEKVLRDLAEKMVEENYVKPSFVKAVLEREKDFPTGLPTASYGVAIPHCDTVHVISPGVAVGILKEPIRFNVMGCGDEEVLVKVIFMLAIKEPNKQLEMLEKLTKIFQNDSILKSIVHSDKMRIYETLNKYLSDDKEVK